MNQWREASAETNEKTTVWIKTKQKRLSRSVLLIKHTPLQLYRRCCRGNNTRVKREQAWCKHTHAALWLALSIIDQPWGQHTWRRGRRGRPECSSLCPLPSLSGVFITLITSAGPLTSDLWPRRCPLPLVSLTWLHQSLVEGTHSLTILLKINERWRVVARFPRTETLSLVGLNIRGAEPNILTVGEFHDINILYIFHGAGWYIVII